LRARGARGGASPDGEGGVVGTGELRVAARVHAHRPHERQAMVEIHRLAFGPRGVAIDQHQLVGEPALHQRIGKRRAHHAGTNQANLVGGMLYGHTASLCSTSAETAGSLAALLCWLPSIAQARVVVFQS